MQHLVCAIFIFQTRSRACLKNHFRNLQAPLCGIFYPHSVAVARYAALIRIKSPTNWDSQFTKSLFQTRSSLQGTIVTAKYLERHRRFLNFLLFHKIFVTIHSIYNSG